MNKRKTGVTIILYIYNIELKMKSIRRNKDKYNIGKIIVDQEGTMFMFINVIDIDTKYIKH